MAESEGILWSPSATMSVVDTWEALNPKREPKNDLDKDAFLQLLMTQMKYQDPLNPVSDQEFLGQMAQYSALEQMVNLNTAYSKTQAYSMLGKQVQGVYTDPNTEASEEVIGIVDAVSTKGSEVYLTVDGKEIPLESVTAVGDEYLTDVMLDSVTRDTGFARAQGLVGKRIQAITYDEDGKIDSYVEGVVDYVKFDNSTGASVLMVGTKEVLPSEVASVSDGSTNPFLLGKTVKVRKSSSDGSSTTDSSVGITDVIIRNEKAYLQVINGEGETSEVAIDKLNYIMESMNYIGKRIEHDSYNGEVTDIVITNGTVYMQIQPDDGGDIQELSYKSFIEED